MELIQAIKKGADVSELTCLLDLETNVNFVDDDGLSPLTTAVKYKADENVLKF